MSNQKAHSSDVRPSRTRSKTRFENISEELSKLFYPVYKRFIEPRSEFVKDIEKGLVQADRNQPTEIFISSRLGFGVVSGWVVALFTTILLVNGVTTQLDTFSTLEGVGVVANALVIIIASVAVAIIQFLFFGVLGGLLGVLISKVRIDQIAKARSEEIERLLPDAVAFAYCQSVGGMNRIDIIRSVSKSEDTYGEVSKEFSRAVHYMDVFSEDPNTALSRVANTTPSDSLSEFLNDLLSQFSSGGRMDTFLESQLNTFLTDVEQTQDAELDKLELFNEIYITASLFPVISLILVGIASAMGYFGSGLLLANVYFLIPIVQVVATGVTAILFVQDYGSGVLTPDEGDAFDYVKDDSFKIGSASVVKEYVGDDVLFNQIYANEIKNRIVSFLSDPTEYLIQTPKYVFFFTVPFTVVYLILAGIIGELGTSTSMWVDDGFRTTVTTLFIPLLFLLLPYSILYEIKQYNYGKITDGLTNDLTKLANTNEQGITLRESILITAQSGSSRLSDEFETIYKKQEYGTPIGQSIIEVNNKYKIPRLARIFRIIKSSQEVSTNITEVLKTAADLSAAQDEIEKERVNRTRQQVGVVVLIFLVFIASIILMEQVLLDSIITSESIGASGLIDTAGEPVPLGLITLAYYHGAMIHGGIAGLLAGYIQTGEYAPGVKYSLSMVSVVMLVWFITLTVL